MLSRVPAVVPAASVASPAVAGFSLAWGGVPLGEESDIFALDLTGEVFHF